MRLPKYAVLISAALALGVIVAGCSSKTSGVTSPSTTKESPTIVAIRAYADPATVTTMQGLSEDSLAKYVQNGDAQFKAAVTQTVFDPIAAQVASQLGKFISIQFLSTENQSGYVVVHYTVKFEKADVKVRMVFDADHLVAGQFFE
jgi:hypothetical protein